MLSQSKDEQAEDEQLPPEVEKSIDYALRAGVFLRRGNGKAGGCANRPVTKVSWYPGDPNPLAEILIKYVRQPTSLMLDGREFVILPAEDGAGVFQGTTYQVMANLVGGQWELNIPGVGVTQSLTLDGGERAARDYIETLTDTDVSEDRVILTAVLEGELPGTRKEKIVP